jgi:hypothetical protein
MPKRSTQRLTKRQQKNLKAMGGRQTTVEEFLGLPRKPAMRGITLELPISMLQELELRAAYVEISVEALIRVIVADQLGWSTTRRARPAARGPGAEPSSRNGRRQ